MIQLKAENEEIIKFMREERQESRERRGGVAKANRLLPGKESRRK